MGINGIETAGYPLTGYTARKTGRSAESGSVGFMEMVEEKAAQGKAAGQDEKAFEMAGPHQGRRILQSVFGETGAAIGVFPIRRRVNVCCVPTDWGTGK